MAPIIASLLSSFANIALRNKAHDDDVVDQLNHWATTGLLFALALGIGAKQYVGDPIHCWVPAEYSKKHFQQYCDSYCWVHPMYNVPFEETIPKAEEDRWYNDISYYRWVFILFLIQAFLFYFPHLVWQELKKYSGLNVSKIVAMALDTAMLTQEKREEKMRHITHFIDRWLVTYSQYRYNALTNFRDKCSRVMFCFGKRSGTYLSGLYMLTKILYFVNVIGQFFLLSAFLDINFWTFGFRAIESLFKKGNWQDHHTFPRVGWCDYKVRQLQNLQTYTLQCVLSINLFLEKMYLIFWCWLIMLLVFNAVNLFQWIMRSILPRTGEDFFSKYFLLLNINKNKESKLFKKFVRNYLRTDGVFMMRIVASNIGDMLALDLVNHLWKKFKDTHSLKEDDDIGTNERTNGLPKSPSAPVIEDGDDDLPLKRLD
ncbi:innexin unc-9-like [Biomphalaria glabrata]|uniref:Innexin n=1 Tax=Biomphalaria glabrata TaxID=6526 RepID=A0A2C9JQ78_BIOGL|nr:innexin unc-9-like [Biomphalaria glabrata]XP_013077229.1 innexin unc-9-like [Biomphalaria glabrata]XP_055869485.1 innexin unc-9-like [Biomphalaria glabrata]XP_055869486.1 innexin unc-9-like [Biomphalaria glabrata]